MTKSEGSLHPTLLPFLALEAPGSIKIARLAEEKASQMSELATEIANKY
ncbi:MAG: hypothetical protein QNJ54_10885 [Prochloraceae cyanobacterium]|nr:hypothetical protein [Prochloraceae cyanobacterium]